MTTSKQGNSRQNRDFPPVVQQFRRAIAPRVSFRPDDFLPGGLFHYTTAAGFEGILRERKIRATNFSFMNDPSEIQHGRELTEELLAEHLASSAGLDRIFLQFVVANFNLEMLAEVYVCCFTKLEDDLSQWRAYGTAASERYSIGFDAEQIQSAALALPNASFIKVEYDTQIHSDHISELLQRAFTFIRSHRNVSPFIDQLGEAAASRLAGLVPALKTNAYKPEREWRVVMWAKDGATKPRFDAGRGILRPYLEFQLPNPLPVTSVHVLAPTRRAVALKAAAMLLETAGIAVQPEHSAIPFAE